MAIPVQCQCGKKFSAKPSLAGKKARCPACKTTLTVPQSQTPKTRAKKTAANTKTKAGKQIEVECQCGARFGAGAHLAGKRVACPKCKAPISIPAPESKTPQLKSPKTQTPEPTRPKATSAATKSPITVKCQCGARFAAGAHLAGKKVACPKCKQPLMIKDPAGEMLGVKQLAAETPAPLTPVEPAEVEVAAVAPEPFAEGIEDPGDFGSAAPIGMPASEFDDIFASAESAAAQAPAFTPQTNPYSAPSPAFAASKPKRIGENWSVGTWLIVGTIVMAIIPYILQGLGVLVFLISPPASLIIGIPTFFYIVLYVLVCVIGSLVCMFMTLSNLYRDGHEMVVVLCFFLGLGPSSFVCGWLFGCDRTVMIIWSLLMGTLILYITFAVTLSVVVKSAIQAQ